MASPQTKHGRYSKSLPTRLIERYQRARDDAEILALDEEIALLDSRLADLLSRVDTGESGQLWRAVETAFRKLQKATDTERSKALLELDFAIDAGVTDYQAWDEIALIVEQRRKLVESERKRRVEMQAMVTGEQTMLIVTALVDSVRKHVNDRDALAAISDDIRRLLARGESAR